jgi:hypothetical protein
MLVSRRLDGTLRFDAAAGAIELRPQERAVLARNGARISFQEVQQVGIVGPPLACLSIFLQLRGGESLELGRAPTDDLALAVARAVGEVVGCSVGCIVRLGDSSPGRRDITGTIFVDVIQGFVDERKPAPPAPPRPAKGLYGTDEIDAAAILSEVQVPDVSDLLEPSPDDVPTVVWNPNEPQQEKDAFRRMLDESVEDLLARCDA